MTQDKNQEFDTFVKDVERELQPPARANATARTLEQLVSIIPDDISLADLTAGWAVVSCWAAVNQSSQPEAIAVQKRRETCAEFVQIAPPHMGDLGNAVRAWKSWVDAFQYDDDPRQTAMCATFTRELKEIESAQS